MEHPTIYAKNRHGDAVYKLEPTGTSYGIFAKLLFTTAAGEESYDIDSNEYRSFLKVFRAENNNRITATSYYLRRGVLRKLHQSKIPQDSKE